MSDQPPRKIPRIISRTKSRGQPVETVTVRELKQPAGQEALVKELSKEKHVVKDGCLVAVQHIDKGAVHGVLGATPSHGGRRVVIDVPIQDPELEPYTENPLPGVADTIESYPCQFCSDAVFLTRYGLERHAKQIHPEHFNEIMVEIEKIQKEWERREKERNRLKEKAMQAKARHESYAYTAVRYAQEGRPVHIDEHAAHQGPERFEACKICNLLINIRHPTAMDHHLRAHKKNEELKQQLLETYGEETVNRLTCHECRLVFTDPNKLDQHTVQTHQRRRKFVCKYCGHLCLSMASLNAHKADAHAVVASSNSVQKTRNNQMQAVKHAQKEGRNMPLNYGKDSNFSRLYRLAQEDSVCSTECAECGLRLVRPSLLVRHMLRVHNKASFNCDIKTRGLPDFRIEVVNTKIFWWCCSQRYADRHDFIFHRKQMHLEPTIQMIDGKEVLHENEDREYAEKQQETLLLQPGSSSYNADLVHAHDQTYQVVLPEGIDDNGQILVILRDGDEEKEAYIDGRDLAEMQQEIHEEPLHEEMIDQDGLEGYEEHLTQEQYDQLREQYGDNLEEMLVYNYEEIHNDQILEEEHIIEEGVAEDGQHHHQLQKQGEDLTCDEIFE